MRSAEHEGPSCGNRCVRPPRCAPAPLGIGSARNSWRATGSRHSGLALPGITGNSHLDLALPGIIGVAELFATHRWQCQGLLAPGGFWPFIVGSARFIWRKPPRIGTARNCWRGKGFHRSGLAVPGITGARRVLATHRWHCQGFLARGEFSTPSSKHEKSSLAGAFKFIWWTVGGSNPGPWD